MISRLRQLLACSPADLLCLIEACVVALAVEVGLRALAPGRCFALVRRRPRRDESRERPGVTRLAWAVELADRHLPGRSTCLRRALALSWMLRWRGVAADLHIGVARDGRHLRAHAWIDGGDGWSLGADDRHDYACLPLPARPSPSTLERAAP